MQLVLLALTLALALASLSSRNIRILEGMKVQTVGNLSVTCSDSGTLPYDYAFIAVGVKPPALFRESGLPLGQDGAGLLVNRYLQSWAVPNVFVMGASAFPQNIGYNPTGLVGALTYWSAKAIRENYLKQPGPLVKS